MDGGAVIVIAVIVVMGGMYFAQHPDRTERARFLKLAGFTLMAIAMSLFALFVVGDAFTDTGGWQAAGLVALWMVPLAALIALAWRRPVWATRVLTVLVVAAIAMSAWYAIYPGAWRSFENRNGPIRAIVLIALSAAVAVLGLRRTATAGVMLVVLAVVPPAISSLGGHLGWVPLTVASSPGFLGGVLYLSSAALARRRTPPGRSGPEELPRAA